jgi:hypothetical protein
MRTGCGLCAALVFVATGCAGGSEAVLLPQGRALAASPSLTPAVHLFGDPVVARLEVVLDRRLLDPRRMRAHATFAPYERVGAVALVRRDFGPYARLTYEFTLRCLELDCVRRGLAGTPVSEPGGRRTFRFRPARLLYLQPDSQRNLLRSVNWPPLESVSRINTAQAAGDWFPFRASPTPLPSASYRVAPPVLASALLVGAFALLVFPATLALRRWRARRPAPSEPAEELPKPLEWALALLDRASERDEADRRGALALVADELGRSGFASLAEQATELAWSRDAPSPEAIAELVAHTRELDDAAV